MFAWKRLVNGAIAQDLTAETKAKLFERSGFGAIQVDEPMKGCLAVAVRVEHGILVEIA